MEREFCCALHRSGKPGTSPTGNAPCTWKGGCGSVHPGALSPAYGPDRPHQQRAESLTGSQRAEGPAADAVWRGGLAAGHGSADGGMDRSGRYAGGAWGRYRGRCDRHRRLLWRRRRRLLAVLQIVVGLLLAVVMGTSGGELAGLAGMGIVYLIIGVAALIPAGRPRESTFEKQAGPLAGRLGRAERKSQVRLIFSDTGMRLAVGEDVSRGIPRRPAGNSCGDRASVAAGRGGPGRCPAEEGSARGRSARSAPGIGADEVHPPCDGRRINRIRYAKSEAPPLRRSLPQRGCFLSRWGKCPIRNRGSRSACGPSARP